jgi:hypothetical protein
MRTTDTAYSVPLIGMLGVRSDFMGRNTIAQPRDFPAQNQPPKGVKEEEVVMLLDPCQTSSSIQSRSDSQTFRLLFLLSSNHGESPTTPFALLVYLARLAPALTRRGEVRPCLHHNPTSYRSLQSFQSSAPLAGSCRPLVARARLVETKLRPSTLPPSPPTAQTSNPLLNGAGDPALCQCFL